MSPDYQGSRILISSKPFNKDHPIFCCNFHVRFCIVFNFDWIGVKVRNDPRLFRSDLPVFRFRSSTELKAQVLLPIKNKYLRQKLDCLLGLIGTYWNDKNAGIRSVGGFENIFLQGSTNLSSKLNNNRFLLAWKKMTNRMF